MRINDKTSESSSREMFAKLLYFLGFATFIANCSFDNSFKVEYYLTARNPDRGVFDNGIFQFDLNEKSLRVAFEDMQYRCIGDLDSAYELYYNKASMSEQDVRQLVPLLEPVEASLYTPRCLLIVTSNGQKDSFLLDREYQVSWRSMTFKSNERLVGLIHSVMPIEMRENWIRDIYPLAAQAMLSKTQETTAQ